MHLVIYGDFNCPYSCLASTRADVLIERGLASIDWRAVEHDPDIPAPSRPAEGELAEMLDREVTDVRGLLRPDEHLPLQRPSVQSNTAAAVASFAASPAEARDDLRRRLFAAFWFEGRDIGDAAVVGALGGADPRSGTATATGWRDEWLRLPRPIVPSMVLPDGTVSRGLGALARLADLLTAPAG